MKQEQFIRIRVKLMEQLRQGAEWSDEEILERIDLLVSETARENRLTVKQREETRRELFYSVRKLDILQDSHSGYFAIITCVSYFLIIVGLWSEMPIDGWPVISLGFILSRSLYGLSILWFPHTRESKCSLYVSEGKSKAAVTVILVLYTVLCACFMLRWNLTVGLGCLAGAVIAFLYYCWVAFKHFGGITEDIASFFVQVCEILIPLMALIIYRMPSDFSAM